MAHPDEGLIRAFLDGELGEEEAAAIRDHCGSCPECQAEIGVQEEALARTASALLLLDTSPSVDEARRRVQARGDTPVRTGKEVPSWWSARRWSARSSLPKAASIALLFTAGAASALPGSPVRDWLAQGWAALTGSGGPEVATQEGLRPMEGDSSGLMNPPPQETALRMVPGGDGVEIGLFDLPEDAEIRVLWVQGEEVSVFALEGTRFRTEAGRAEAHSPPGGGVRVEIPNALNRVLLTLDGKTLLRKSGSEVEILDSVQSQSPREVVFGVGPRPNEG